MGLDIAIRTDKNDEIFEGDYHDPINNYFTKHSVSRTFCNLMCRQDVINGEPELDQIGRLTSVDITPIYQMETYGSESGEELEFFLETAESEEERKRILDHARQNKENLKGNIDKVLFSVNALIDKLSEIANLPSLLNDYGYDTLNYKTYFIDFNVDKGQGYIGNNFGQDLRNFKEFLEFVKDKGATTVYFSYG